MPLRIQFRVLALVLVSVGLTACSTSSQGPVAKPYASAGRAAKTGADEFSAEAVERRTEAQARYASAWLHYLNEETDLALEDYTKAALLDPSNELLVLEVTGRLLQFKKHEETLRVLTNATAHARASGSIFARLAMVYSLLGKKDLAIEASQTAIKKMPRLLLGYQYLGQIYLQNRQPAEALKVLDQAAQQPGTDAGFLIELAGLYLDFGRAGAGDSVKPRALELLKRAEAENPTSPVLLQRLAERFGELGEGDKASFYWAKLLDRFPHLPGVRQRLLDYYLRKDDLAKAAEQLKAIIRENPTDPQAYFDLGDVLARQRQPQEAIEQFRKVLLLNPDFAPGYYELARAQINAGQPKEALETLEKARKKFSPSFQGELFTAFAYAGLKDYSNAVSRIEAAEVIARATATNLLTADFYYELAQMQINANQARAALETLDKTRARFRPSFHGEVLAAAAYSRLKDHSNALARLIAAESVARGGTNSAGTNQWLNHEFFFRLGAAYERNQQYGDAEKTFRKVLSLAPDFSEALNYLGYMWAERGENLTEARALIEKAVQLEPQNAAYLDSMAWVLYKLNQPGEALTYMLKAIEHSEEPDATIYDHLGDIYATLKQEDKARQAWEKALAIEPNEQIRKKLGSLTASGGPRR